jgi:hypothetical protein
VGLDRSVFQCERRGERGGEGCGIAPGWRWPFIGAGGRRGRLKPRAAAVIGAFMAAMTGSEGVVIAVD